MNLSEETQKNLESLVSEHPDWTIAHLAKKAGVSVSTVSRYRRNAEPKPGNGENPPGNSAGQGNGNGKKGTDPLIADVVVELRRRASFYSEKAKGIDNAADLLESIEA